MKIKYPSTNRVLLHGAFISPYDAITQPSVRFNKKKNTLYTLLMFDPDAVHGNRIHWLIINSDIILFPYIGPNPPPGSGLHHYHFLLIAQDEPIATPSRPLKKRQISIKTLLKKLGLQGTIVDETYIVSHNTSTSTPL
jgi:phosphatidylethanolamine-binding protein (PEBP) family uncharacterized protein